MVSYIFPGQGSQKLKMGENLFNKFPAHVAMADEILGYSIEELCMSGKDRLNQTEYTQPAIYVVNALTYLENQYETGIKAEYLAGHSLGEYNALYAAEAFDFSTGLMLVKERGRLMSLVNNGGMAAIVGLELIKVENILAEISTDSVQIANINSPSQCVISGPMTSIVDLKNVFETAGAILYSILNVSGAFHTKYMRDAAQEFETFIKYVSIKKPKIPVIANVNALPYETDEISIRKNLVSHIHSPVKWLDSMRWILRNANSKDVVEITSGRPVLTGLLEQIKREST